MKKNIFLFAFTALLFTTACNSDDSPIVKPETTTELKVEGNFKHTFHQVDSLMLIFADQDDSSINKYRGNIFVGDTKTVSVVESRYNVSSYSKVFRGNSSCFNLKTMPLYGKLSNVDINASSNQNTLTVNPITSMFIIPANSILKHELYGEVNPNEFFNVEDKIATYTFGDDSKVANGVEILHKPVTYTLLVNDVEYTQLAEIGKVYTFNDNQFEVSDF